MTVKYQIQIGTWSADSTSDANSELTRVHVHAATGCLGKAEIALYVAAAGGGGLLDQAVGAAAGAVAGAGGLGGGAGEPSFATNVCGNEIKDGDAMSVTLVAGDNSETVFTGEVLSADSHLGITNILGASGARKLATARLNQVYENQSADQVINDLAGQAGATAGQIGASISYPYLVIDETCSVFDHIKILAMRENMECYFNTDDELTVEKFEKSSADHEVHYGIHVLDLQVFAIAPATSHTRVYTESPASSQGQTSWHWLTKDASGFQSEAGSGANLIAMSSGAIRTKDAADQLATSRHGAIKDASTSGRLTLLGNPSIRIADAIEIKDAPKPELNGLFKVTDVEHRFSKHGGFVTRVGFTGHGGAEAAGGLLGIAGDLAGAVGF